MQRRWKEEGKKEGIKEGKAEIVIKMYAEKFPIETITKLTGFKEEDIVRIVNLNVK